MSCKRLLYAPNIHQGGGKTLLLPILESLKSVGDIVFVLDARMSLPDGGLAGEVHLVKPTVFSRLWFEWRLRRMLSSKTLLLCMGNLPPLFAHQGIQHVFVQNRYLIDPVSLASFSLSVHIRLTVERWWLKSRARHVKNFFVQTATMQSLLHKSLGRESSILPFVVLPAKKVFDGTEPVKIYDFVYVASGEPHKKHRALIEGWVELAKKGAFPSLCLTLNDIRFPELCAWIRKAQERYGLHVEMKGELTHQEVQELYVVSKAMIYPSVFESFGVPLLEAAAMALPIVTADVDYVYDVINPTAVFDVEDPVSIADAVRNNSNVPASIVSHLLNVESFLNETFLSESSSNDSW